MVPFLCFPQGCVCFRVVNCKNKFGMSVLVVNKITVVDL